MTMCAVVGCDSRTGRTKDISFFSFPKDKILCKVRVEKIARGRPDDKSKPFIPNHNHKVCSKHFDDDQYECSENFLEKIGCEVKFRRKLKKDAIPLLLLPVRSHQRQQPSCRPSAESIISKKRSTEIVGKIHTASNDVDDFDFDGPLIATTIISEADIPVESPLETLAVVASTKSRLPLPTWKTSNFNVQSQTPVWSCTSRGVQVSVTTVTSGTQTDWENDVPTEHVTLELPELNISRNILYSDMGEDSFRDSCASDDTWLPSDDSDDDDEEEELELGVGQFERQTANRKFIVCESQLDLLFNKCNICSRKVTINKKLKGCAINYSKVCENCDTEETWTNQPSSGTLPVGHLELAAGILFSGSNMTKFLRALQFAGIKCFTEATFYNIQKAYLIPAVMRVWDSSQESMIREMKMRGHPIKIGSDGRCCSPGHTAQYCTYSTMDLETGKILDMQLVQSNEVKSSHAMELEGLKRSLEFIKGQGLDISHLVTDRHSSIKKYMREYQPDIIHWYNVWHVAKGIYKKLEAVGKKRGCEKVRAWARSISNHLYWCAASSNGDSKLVEQKWLSITNHVADIHEGHGDRFPRCEHEELDKRNWMKKGCKPHAEMSKIVENKMLIKDIGKLSPAEQTSELEAFHKVMCGWVPKFSHYTNISMESRCKIAALHFNENSRREQSKTREGVGQYSVSFPKARKGEPVIKEVKTEQTFDYVIELMDNVLELRNERTSYAVTKQLHKVEDKDRPPPIAQSTPKRVSKQQLIDTHVRRFNKC